MPRRRWSCKSSPRHSCRAARQAAASRTPAASALVRDPDPQAASSSTSARTGPSKAALPTRAAASSTGSVAPMSRWPSRCKERRTETAFRATEGASSLSSSSTSGWSCAMRCPTSQARVLPSEPLDLRSAARTQASVSRVRLRSARLPLERPDCRASRRHGFEKSSWPCEWIKKPMHGISTGLSAGGPLIHRVPRVSAAELAAPDDSSRKQPSSAQSVHAAWPSSA
mmetsp:Transcript_82204/g.266405  ORF Transcript_82204/g.266405 Transcript_82204/m.266405 type:complete len:226 (-) Transcript_82204:523-1200(-)